MRIDRMVSDPSLVEQGYGIPSTESVQEAKALAACVKYFWPTLLTHVFVNEFSEVEFEVYRGDRKVTCLIGSKGIIILKILTDDWTADIDEEYAENTAAAIPIVNDWLTNAQR